MKTRIAILLVLPFFCSGARGVRASQRLTMNVWPAQAFAPATVRAEIRVEPNAENKAVQIVADSGDFYRSSVMTIEGDRGPHLITHDFRGIPGGRYEIRGVLLDRAGHERAAAQRPVWVVAPAGR